MPKDEGEQQKQDRGYMTDCVEHSCLGTSINSNAHPFEWQNLPNLVRDINSTSD